MTLFTNAAIDTNSPQTIATSKVANKPEIVVNGVVIDESEILNEMQYHPAENQRDAMIKSAESLIIKELLTQQVHKKSIDVSNQSDEAAIDVLLEKEVPTPNLSKDECWHFYQANKRKFITSPILEVRHILISAPESDIEFRQQAETVANEILQQIKENENAFSTLAEKYSHCPSKEQGGSLGQISKGQTVPEFERALFLSKVGLQPRPIESRYGYHITKVENREEGSQLPYDLVEDEIKHYLTEKVRRKSTAQYLQILIQEANIEGFVFDVSDSPLIQ
ncbi:peptidylprolyl isomerase [Bermanella sp. R86510]|uniref:peptidylprolyl isomerase n=1 Tax=unclassified Bermanella TaxID=2627862 RepID=UPI0037C5D2C5